MKIVKCAVILIATISLTFLSSAQSIDNRSAGIANLKGRVEIKRVNDKIWRPAKIGMILHQGDAIMTAADGWAVLNLDKGKTASIEIKKNTRLSLSKLKEDDANGAKNTLLNLAIGKILIKVQKLRKESSKFEVKTPTSIIGVRGTKFSVEVENLK